MAILVEIVKKPYNVENFSDIDFILWTINKNKNK